MDCDARKLFVLDTNVLLHEPLAIYSFQEHDVMVPMTVLEELDNIKDRQKDVSREARIAIRTMEDVFRDATPEQIAEGIFLGNRVGENCSGRLAIFADHHLPEGEEVFTNKENDNRIINAALYLQKKHPERTVVLVTKDINMRLKAKGAGLKHVEDYRTDQLIDDIRLLAKGFQQLEGQFWEQVGECESLSSGRDVFHWVDEKLLPDTHINQYLLDGSDNFAARIHAHENGRLQIKDLGRERLMGRHAWGVHPKNIYQAMALDALLDPTLDLVILTGPAGCGKTLLAMA